MEVHGKEMAPIVSFEAVALTTSPGTFDQRIATTETRATGTKTLAFAF